ncbi:hypothetical protein DIE22_31780 [Burkholderia sp. Bp9142]|nr:hypothetical protein DIE22_31780 [Burkholderia sp. Bp9142]RQR54179.1 hypothetical protein DIE21_07830 [Burkholderia sp. Bp9140]
MRATTESLACRAATIPHRPAACRRASVRDARDARVQPTAPGQRTPEPAILEMPACRVLARLRTRHDDFSIYQGYRRYADIVAGRAPNAQDGRFFAT